LNQFVWGDFGIIEKEKARTNVFWMMLGLSGSHFQAGQQRTFMTI
jgi:hypothetical protein